MTQVKAGPRRGTQVAVRATDVEVAPVGVAGRAA